MFSLRAKLLATGLMFCGAVSFGVAAAQEKPPEAAPDKTTESQPTKPVTEKDLSAAIDGEIAKVYARDKITPTALSSDEEFVRRVYFDLTGLPPTRDEAVAFLDSKEKNKREALIKSLNAATRGGKAKLDPAVACPKLQSLAAVERELVAYMEKNKEWCGIPDDAMANARKGLGRTSGIAGQACRVAVQMKRARAQAEAQARNGGGGPQVQRLPTGPL